MEQDGRPHSCGVVCVCVCVVTRFCRARLGADEIVLKLEVKSARSRKSFSGRAARRNRIFGRAEISWTETMMFFWTVWDGETDMFCETDTQDTDVCYRHTDEESDLWSHTLSSGVLICHTPIMHCKHEGQTHSITTQPEDSDWHHTHTQYWTHNHNAEHTHTQHWTHNHNAEHTHTTLDTHTHNHNAEHTHTHTTLNTHTHTITTLNTHTHTYRVRACVFGLCSSDALE